MDPIVERITFGLSGSTQLSTSTTSEQPAASAVRMMVPSLPGSRTCQQAAISGTRPGMEPEPARENPVAAPLSRRNAAWRAASSASIRADATIPCAFSLTRRITAGEA